MPRPSRILPVFPKDTVRLMYNTYAYGRNDWNQASGNFNTITPKLSRTVIAEDMDAASCGWNHTLLLGKNGYAYAFGDNAFNKCVGAGVEPYDPIVEVTFVAVDIKQVIAASEGNFGSSFTVSNGGTLSGWGENSFSICRGNGDTSPQPLRGILDTDVAQASADSNHILWVKNNGDVWACGSNVVSESRGDGDTLLATTAALIDTGAQQVACGDESSLILKTNGEVWGFGANTYGQVRGDGVTSAGQLDKFLITTNVAKVVSGASHTVFLLNNGDVLACGFNSFGQCRGDGTTSTNQSTLFQMASGAKDIAASKNTTFIWYDDLTMWACGANNEGQVLGNGTNTSPISTLTVLQDNTHTRYIMNDSPGADTTAYGVGE